MNYDLIYSDKEVYWSIGKSYKLEKYSTLFFITINNVFCHCNHNHWDHISIKINSIFLSFFAKYDVIFFLELIAFAE